MTHGARPRTDAPTVPEGSEESHCQGQGQATSGQCDQASFERRNDDKAMIEDVFELVSKLKDADLEDHKRRITHFRKSTISNGDETEGKLILGTDYITYGIIHRCDSDWRFVG